MLKKKNGKKYINDGVGISPDECDEELFESSIMCFKIDFFLLLNLKLWGFYKSNSEYKPILDYDLLLLFNQNFSCYNV